jgi:hypothetical protein
MGVYCDTRTTAEYAGFDEDTVAELERIVTVASVPISG